MTNSIALHPAGTVSVSRRAELILAILAMMVLLGAIAVVEVGVLTAVTVVSSGTNHGGH